MREELERGFFDSSWNETEQATGRQKVMKLFDTTLAAMEKKMDLAFNRHALITSNIANSETPNYKARELDFAGELEKALGRKEETLVKTNPQHLDLASNQGSHIVLDNTGAVGADGNNVDLDIAIGKLSENARSYSGTTNLLLMKFRILRMAASGRGGF